MKKLFIIPILFLVLLTTVSALYPLDEPVYCESSIEEHWDSYTLNNLGINLISNDFDCICFREYTQEGAWQPAYCKSDLILVEERYAMKKFPPECVPTQVVEQREIMDARCRICPAPTNFGTWNFSECLTDGTAVYRRTVNAFLFSPAVDVCYQKNTEELDFREVNNCDALNSPFIVPTNIFGVNPPVNYFYVLTLVAMAGVSYIYFKRRSNKR